MRTVVTLAILILFGVSKSEAQIVDQSLGVDQRVNYESLLDIGPWDDRNYMLTAEDLAVLADNEHELILATPAFYRVMIRKEFPDTPRTGGLQYPRSTLNSFLQRYGGYKIGDRLYEKVSWDGQRYNVMLDDAQAPIDFFNTRIFMGEQQLINSAAESAIAINPVNPDLVVAGVNKSGQTQFYSSDGGETWNQSAPLLGSECCDPTLGWSFDGSKAYVATLDGGNNIWFYRSGDFGASWDDLPGIGRVSLTGPGAGLNDKEFLHVDIYPNSPGLDNIYLCWHEVNIQQFAVSSDFGESFDQISFGGVPIGIGCDITTDSDGNVYFFWGANGPRDIQMLRSTDQGASFDPPIKVADTQASFDFPIPSMESRRAWIYVAADVDLTRGLYHNRLYATWTDTTAPDNDFDPDLNHAVITFAYSDDRGDSWNFSTPHELDDVNEVDRWNQWMKVDKYGTVHVVFYDTREFLPDRDGVDLYHSQSTDGGVTWSAPNRITTQSSPNAAGSFEFGDYNGIDFSADGGLTIFSDNRNPSVDVYVAYQPTVLPPDDIFFSDFELGDSIIFTDSFGNVVAQ